MSIVDELSIIEKMDDSDQEKIRYFLKLLVKEKKYKKLKREIDERRKEIAEHQGLTHDEIWQKIDV